MFFNLFKSLSFLSLSSSPLLKILPTGEYSNFAFGITSALHPKSLAVKYSYFSNSPLDSAEILVAYLSKSY